MAIATGTLAAIGMGLGAASGIYGAHQQGQINNQNFAAQQAYQRYLQNLGQSLMQTGVNPFASQIQNFAQSMPQFQPGQAATYDPTMLGDAPQVTAPTFGGATLGAAPTVQAGQIGGPGQIDIQQIMAQMVGPGGGVQAGMIGLPTGENFNMGQDALMQMMRRQFNPVTDQNLQDNLAQLYGGASFDPNGVLSTLAPIDQRMIEEQVTGLRGASGSLGQRFGSDLVQNERMLRENAMQDIGARNAQITQSMWESGQNRRLQALGLGVQQNQFLSQFPLLAAQLNMQAAGQLQQGGLNFAQLAQQAQIANQSAGLQAGTFNAQQALQAALANQGAGLQAGQANQAAALQAALQTQSLGQSGQQFNVAQALQAALANQGMLGQYGLQGAQFQQQAGLANQSAILQALLSNQGLAGQFALANQGAANQAGQFNAGQQQNQQQFNFGANMQQNQMILQALMGAAGIQQQQAGMNAGIFGALAGVGVPQAQAPTWPGAIGDASSYLMLPWLLQQTRAR